MFHILRSNWTALLLVHCGAGIRHRCCDLRTTRVHFLRRLTTVAARLAPPASCLLAFFSYPTVWRQAADAAEQVVIDGAAASQDQAVRDLSADDSITSLTISFPVERARAERGAALTDAGLAEIGKMTRLRELSLDSPLITDAGMAHLAGLRQLQKLAVSGDKLTDAWGDALSGRLPELVEIGRCNLPHVNEIAKRRPGTTAGRLRVLRSFPNLESFDGNHRMIDGPGLAELARVKTLRKVNVGGVTAARDELGLLTQVTQLRLGINTRITTDNILALQSLTGLKNLSIGGITDAGMPVLEKLPHLESLSMMGVVSGAGMRSLVGLKCLHSLSMSVVADADFHVLAGLPNLERLTISGRFNDDDIQALATSKSLRVVQISKSQVTANGGARLQGKLPSAQVMVVGEPVATAGAGFDRHMRYLADVYEKIVGEPLPTDQGR